MSDIAIRVEGIGKRYKIGRKKSGELRESFSHFWDRFRRSLPSEISMKEGFAEATKDDEFWALKDISFEVKQGEAVGIIGRNGAGKSTLLKVLSRITKPTTGRFEINGRVSSLLEVGTGFHPELTGRENIYLNGTILGMRRAEIKSKFDEIIDFSGVEEFLDTPVKHYSSGMKVRLAFSVAAHLEPEILIIDEVLAVGDAEFQKKCLGKMEDVTGEGRTVLFVSHNMGAVERLCTKGIVLSDGMSTFQGLASHAISNYLSSFDNSLNELVLRKDRNGSLKIKVNSISLKDQYERIIDHVCAGQFFHIELHYQKSSEENLDRTIASITIKTALGQSIFLVHNRMTNEPFHNLDESGVFRCSINKLPLTASRYYISFSLIHDGEYLDAIENAFELNVVPGKYYDSAEIPPSTHSISMLDASWKNI